MLYSDAQNTYLYEARKLVKYTTIKPCPPGRFSARNLDVTDQAKYLCGQGTTQRVSKVAYILHYAIYNFKTKIQR